jgi:hypothetical protein
MLTALVFALTLPTCAPSCQPTYAATGAGADPATGTLKRLRALMKVDGRRISGVSLDDILEEVRRIWRPYVDVDFTDASGAGAEYDDRLTLVVTDRPRTASHADTDALGWVDFRGAGRPVDTITVSLDVARKMMSETHWGSRLITEFPPRFQRTFITQVVGRSAAHELGHYLLRSPAHTSKGLMRARIMASEIFDRDPTSLQLEKADIEFLQQRASAAVWAGRRPGPDSRF